MHGWTPTTSRNGNSLPILDWKQNADLRSFDHLHDGTFSISKDWTLGPVMDQGQTGSCCGHGFASALSAKYPHYSSHRAALGFYELATSRDTYPGHWPEQDTGSSVNAVMRAGRDLTLLSAWKWCTSASAVADAIATVGPVVIGVAWHASMDTDPGTGVLHVDTSTPVRGGHCVALRAWNATSRLFALRNSWGAGWANGGETLVNFDDLQALLTEGGEAAVPVVR